VGKEELRTEEDAAKIHPDFTVPLLDRNMFRGLVHLDRGIVEEDDQGGIPTGPHETLHRIRVCHVRLDRECLAAEGLDLLHRFLRARGIDVSQHDSGTLPSELQGGGAAYSRASAGYHRDWEFTPGAHSVAQGLYRSSLRNAP